MTTTTNQPKPTSTVTPAENAPVFYVYSIRDRGRREKAIFTKIGAAWPTKDGWGFSIQLDALPIGDRIVLLEPLVNHGEPEASV